MRGRGLQRGMYVELGETYLSRFLPEDKAGNIWFGSADAGACRYDGKTFTNFSATAPPRN